MSDWKPNPVLKFFDIENEDLPCAQGKTVKKRGKTNAEDSAMLSGINEAGRGRAKRRTGFSGETDKAKV